MIMLYCILWLSILVHHPLFSMTKSKVGYKEIQSARKRERKDTPPRTTSKKVKFEEEVAKVIRDIERNEKLLSQSALAEYDSPSDREISGERRVRQKQVIAENGEPLVLLAIRYGHIDLVCKILTTCAQTDNNKQKYTPLHLAVIVGNEELVDAILENDAEVNAQGSFGMTPLHLAALHNKVAIARKLIEKGADVDAARDSLLPTALHIAAHEGNEEMVELLLQCKAKIVRNITGQTPVHIAKNNSIRRKLQGK